MRRSSIPKMCQAHFRSEKRTVCQALKQSTIRHYTASAAVSRQERVWISSSAFSINCNLHLALGPEEFTPTDRPQASQSHEALKPMTRRRGVCLDRKNID